MERQCRSKVFKYLNILPTGSIFPCNFGTTLSSHFVKYAKKKMQQQPAFPGFFRNIFRKKPTITQAVNQPISAIPIRQYDTIPNYSSMT